MDIQRQAFEKEYNKHHPNDMATRLQNGNYSGWVKQASWEMWQQAQKSAVPEGFVLVNKNKSEAFSKKLNDYLDDAWRDGSAFDDGFVSVDEINHDKIWSLVVEAQEPTND